MNVVLAHGFFGFKRLFGVAYFNGVAEHLRESFPAADVRVLATEVNPVGRVPRRGRDLAEQIVAALDSGALDAAQPVHIVAHSMGGLDARFALSPSNPENIAARVASLTTISTPHRGSPVADWLTGKAKLSASIAEAAATILDLSGGLWDLTSAGAAEFNERYRDHPSVRYFSCAGRGRDGSPAASLPLRMTYALIGEPNDGLVTVASAAWGDPLGTPWPADHADEIGHDLNRPGFAKPTFDYLAQYRAIVERLRSLQASAG